MGAVEPDAPYAYTADNRPVPLEHSPLALTRERYTQMSFGERAALEGVLAQIRPRVAVEIGTAEGGTLARVAAYSDEVHAIDLTHDAMAFQPPAHVALHGGTSAEILPRLLAELTASERAVDFVLVDGDHSAEGVAGDLRALLASPATARCTILAHDTTNEEVRAGIESVGLDRHQKVVYYELDFVPGYMFWEGAARYSVWGGLGLILCDHARSRAYSQSPRQSRYYEPYEAIHAMRAQIMADAGEATSGDGDRRRRSGTQDGSSSELDRLRRLLADTESELARTQRALEIAYNSRSWKLTAPARAAAQIMRERRGAGT